MNSSRVIYFLVIAVLISACSGNDSVSIGTSGKKNKKQVTLYYLHSKRQCKTCNAISQITQEVTGDVFRKEVAQGKVRYENQLLSDASALAEKFKCVFAGVYLVASSDSSETITNLTKPAFYFAVSNPDSLQRLLIQSIRIKLDSLEKTDVL
jgi:hypothetical protein